MGEYHYKITPGEMEALYAQLGSLGAGGQIGGNYAAQDVDGAENHQDVMRNLLDGIKDRNHDEQGHPE